MACPLLENEIKVKNPLHLFQQWYEEAKSSNSVLSNTFCLTTTKEDGQPSGRMMTLSGFSRFGFLFLTSASSRKGREMAEIHKVSMTFDWGTFMRMVCVEGEVEQCPISVAEELFKKRKVEAKVWSNLCKQGTPVKNREYLENREEELLKKYGDDMPIPDDWKAYIVKPSKIIFWQKNSSDLISDKIAFYRPKPGSDCCRKQKEFSHAGEDGWMYYRIQS